MSSAAAEFSSPGLAEPVKVAARPPRYWPAIALVAAYWLGRLIVPLVIPGGFAHVFYLFWSPIFLGLLFLIWLLGLSRLAWTDRWWAGVCLLWGGVSAALLVDGSMRFGVYMYGLPVAITVMVLGLWLGRLEGTWWRRLLLAGLCVLAWSYYSLLRMDGVSGAFEPEFSWRWQPTAEQQFLANLPPAAKETPAIDELVATAADWPGFRGASRDGILHGVKLDRDWQAHPPKELWRRRVGPGWSSFAVIGNYAFTQEQRGKNEAVVCFDIRTGKEIWAHLDEARFEEPVGGAGPRATPTFDDGKLYTLGGSGRLNCLEAATGKPVWTRDMAADASAKPPAWGFSSSPLIHGGIVTVWAGGADGKSVMAYDAQTGKPKWSGGKGTHSYSSMHLATIGGREHLLSVSEFGVQAFDPADGSLLWEHEWQEGGVFRCIQPMIVGDSQVLIGTGMSVGTRALTIEESKGWTATEAWTSKAFKPYFNDAVQHEGHAYGFDDQIFACIDVATGERRWKKGRYGSGQVLLIADSGLLLITTELTGEVVLVEANPDEHVELGKFKALTGKTWNHPVITGNKLLVRNDEEMACFELALEEAGQEPQ